MSDYDHLEALIDDAVEWADQFCSLVVETAMVPQVDAGAPISAKAIAYRAALFRRFADITHSAAQSAGCGKPVSTSSLVRSAFETFTHLFELRDHLDAAFDANSLDALDALLTQRLFGDEAEDVSPSAGRSDAVKAQGFTLDLATAAAETCPQVALPIPHNDARDDSELDRVDPGASLKDNRADLALRRLMRALIAIEMSFDNSYRLLDDPICRLETMFSPASARGQRRAGRDQG